MMDKQSYLSQSHGGCHSAQDWKVVLKNEKLWNKFHSLETEMIITKNGRRMFPSLQVQFSGLDRNAFYCVYLEIYPTMNCRYKYSNSGGWTPSGTGEAQSSHRHYLHPDSPSSGEYWMSQSISFGRVKLTNIPTPPSGQIMLSSMHKYQPRIVIAQTSDPRAICYSPCQIFTFPETQFIAVTAYQNERITKLKIDNNPFAKGFRETGLSKKKKAETEIDNEKTTKQIRAISPIVIDDEVSSPDSSFDSPRSSTNDHNDNELLASSTQQPYMSFTYSIPTYYPHYIPTMHNFHHPYMYDSSFYYSMPNFNTQTPAEDLSLQKDRRSPTEYKKSSNPCDKSNKKVQNTPKCPVELPKRLTDFSIRSIIGFN